MFDNARLFFLASSGPQIDLDAVAQANPFTPCGPTQEETYGFVPPREENGALVECINGEYLMCLAREVRVVPASALDKATKEAARKVEQETGRKPGRKEMKSLKADALLALLPRAFPKLTKTMVWYSPADGLLVVFSSSPQISDRVISLLVRHDESWSVMPYLTNTSPQAAMHHWLSDPGFNTPFALHIGNSCGLKDEDTKAAVTFSNHPLDNEIVRQHLREGLMPTWLLLFTRNELGFKLTGMGELQSIEYPVPDTDSSDADAFDANVVLVTSSFREALGDLTDALGGLLSARVPG